MPIDQPKEHRRSIAHVVCPGSISGRPPTKAGGRRPYRAPALVDEDLDSDGKAPSPTPIWDELLGPLQRIDYGDEEF
jgi:hypothetical protein